MNVLAVGSAMCGLMCLETLKIHSSCCCLKMFLDLKKTKDQNINTHST